MIVTMPSWLALSLMSLVAGLPITAVKHRDRLTQELLGIFWAFPLVAAFGELGPMMSGVLR
jgi:hypothetical protein